MEEVDRIVYDSPEEMSVVKHIAAVVEEAEEEELGKVSHTQLIFMIRNSNLRIEWVSHHEPGDPVAPGGAAIHPD